MKRLAIAAGLVLFGTGAAMADCVHSASPNSNEDSILFDAFVVAAGDLEACNVTSPVSVPAGHYGVFRQRVQGFAALGPDDEAVFTLNSNGDVVSQTVRGEFEDVDFTRYTATGLVGAETSYSADITVDMQGASALDAEATMDTLDLLVGYTTLEDQEDALDAVGLQQLGMIVHLDGNASQLRGGDQRLEGENEVAVLGSYGSYNFGATARYNLADGFSVLGGVSLFSLGAEGADAAGVLATGAIRYVDPTGATVRFFGEGGFEAAGLGLSLSRTYDAGSGDIAASGSGTGLLGAAYVRGGALWEPNSNNQVVLSASLKQSVLGLSSFVEDDSDTDPNLFAADYSGLGTSVTTIKTGIDWTTQLSHDLDLTASGAVGAAFGSGAAANIFGVSEFTGEAVTGAAQSVVFAQYGLRLGWTPSPGTKLDGFVQGTTGTGIGTHAQIGAAYRMSF